MMVLESISISDDRTAKELYEAANIAHRNATECRREADRWDKLGIGLYKEADEKRGR